MSVACLVAVSFRENNVDNSIHRSTRIPSRVGGRLACIRQHPSETIISNCCTVVGLLSRADEYCFWLRLSLLCLLSILRENN